MGRVGLTPRLAPGSWILQVTGSEGNRVVAEGVVQRRLTRRGDGVLRLPDGLEDDAEGVLRKIPAGMRGWVAAGLAQHPLRGIV